LKRKQYDAVRKNMFLKKDDASGVANWILQIVDLSICTTTGFFDFVPSGFDPVWSSIPAKNQS